MTNQPGELLALSKHLEAAQGYLGLGMPMEAWNELEEIAPTLRASREVLAMRVNVCRALGKWELMAEIARSLGQSESGDLYDVLGRAYAARRQEGVEAAIAVLEEARPRFPTEATIPYELARYRALSGQIDEAKKLLAEAFTIDASLRLTALDDPDLEGVW